MSEEKVIRTACSSHCGGACLLRVHVKNGVITRIETDDGEEPQFRACLRGRAYRQRLYAPDRLRYPLKRIGERGEGKFARISWGEALEIVAGELTRVRETYGSSAIIFWWSGGDPCWLNSPDLIANVLIRTGGYTATWGWQSHGAAMYALVATYGTPYTSNSPDDLLNSRLIIMWGWNPAVNITDTNTSWYLTQAREAGIRIVSVDPRYTSSTAAFAQQWIPIRPGTDAAMLIAMAYVIIDERLYDQKFLDTHTIGFDQFKDYVLGKEDNTPKTPGWAAGITGVPATVISNLAREYATTKPAALMDGIAAGRSACGEQYHRAACALAAMTGNVGIHGGNAGIISRTSPGGSYNWGLMGLPVGARMKGGSNPIDAAPPRRYSLPADENYWKGLTSSARVNRNFVADAILKGKAGGYPADYKLIYIVNANWINQAPNSNKIAKALKALEFVVVQEQFMTATAKFADIVLPTNTLLERNDITVGGATPFYGYMNKVIDSLYESKSHFEIAAELAAKLGITDFSDKTEDEWLRELTKGYKDIPDYDTFKREGIHKVRLSEPRISFEKNIKDPTNNPFPTPSGKIEIYSQQLADMENPMLPPVPKYIETWENLNDPLAKKYPLQLITTHLNRRAHTQFDNIPWLRELEAQAMWINSADAKARGICDGDKVRVFNDRGEIIIPAKVTERIMPGVVDVPQGAWYHPDERQVDRGACANVLTKDDISPGGALPSNTSLVQVKKAGL